MRKTISWLILMLVLATEAFLFVVPRFGSSPVSPKVRLAIEAHRAGPKAELDAAVDQAMAEDDAESKRSVPVFWVLAAAFNVALIWAFVNYGLHGRAVTETTPASASRRGRA